MNTLSPLCTQGLTTLQPAGCVGTRCRGVALSPLTAVPLGLHGALAQCINSLTEATALWFAHAQQQRTASTALHILHDVLHAAAALHADGRSCGPASSSWQAPGAAATIGWCQFTCSSYCVPPKSQMLLSALLGTWPRNCSFPLGSGCIVPSCRPLPGQARLLRLMHAAWSPCSCKPFSLA